MSNPDPTRDGTELTTESVCTKCGYERNLEPQEDGTILCTACLDEEENEDIFNEEKLNY